MPFLYQRFIQGFFYPKKGIFWKRSFQGVSRTANYGSFMIVIILVFDVYVNENGDIRSSTTFITTDLDSFKVSSFFSVLPCRDKKNSPFLGHIEKDKRNEKRMPPQFSASFKTHTQQNSPSALLRLLLPRSSTTQFSSYGDSMLPMFNR